MVDFDKISGLSMLSVSKSEREALKHDIESVISFADKIAEFDENTQNAAVLRAACADELREDVPQPSFSRNEILSNVPKTSEGFISVPKSF